MKFNTTAIIMAINKALRFGGMGDPVIPRAEPKSGRRFPSVGYKLPLSFDPEYRKQMVDNRINGGKPERIFFYRPVKLQDRSKYSGADVRRLQAERGCGRPVT